jgi:hypothetical protein
MLNDINPKLCNNNIQYLAERFPELNIKQIADALGINYKLMHHYTNGTKNPGPERRKEIEEYIHTLAMELLKVNL